MKIGIHCILVEVVSCDNQTFYHAFRYPKDDKIAFYYTTERKETVGIGQMTFGELKGKVGLYASALRKIGIKKGDIVAGYLPNCPEAIIAMAAAASIGAIW